MLLAALSVALAEPYALADAGITFELPPAWEMREWSDWDFKGRSADASVALEAWYTPFQQGLSPAGAKEFAGLYSGKIAAMRGVDPEMEKVEIVTIVGRQTARTDMKFSFDKKGAKGVLYAAAFPVDGKVMHVITYAAASNAGRAEKALSAIVERITVQKPPADLSGLGGTLPTELGFSATLPEQWRRPLPSEEGDISGMLAGIGPKDPAKCGQAVRPYADGTADLMLLCDEDWHVGIVDADSFEDEQNLLKGNLFGKAADKVPKADPIQTKDRMGFLLRPEINGKDMRLAVMSYDRGAAVGWVIGPSGHASYLEEVARATMSGLTFTGPNGGLPEHEIGAVVVHTLTYNPLHPGVLCCVGATLMFLGGVAVLVFRSPKRDHPVV